MYFNELRSDNWAKQINRLVTGNEFAYLQAWSIQNFIKAGSTEIDDYYVVYSCIKMLLNFRGDETV